MNDILLLPLLSALFLAAASGPVGCFVAWRRMAFYGDALAHASLLGIAVGLVAGIGATAGVTLLVVTASLVLLAVQRSRRLASDSLLAILAQTALAGGIVLIYLTPGLQVSLFGYLFGDILSAGPSDLMAVAIVAAIVVSGLVRLWRPLLLATLHEELAQAEGVPILRMQVVTMAAIAACVAVGIHLAGVLLMSALLVIPPATARGISHSPKQMAVLSTAAGMIGVSAGVFLSGRYDLPTGPAIVLALGVLFVASSLVSLRRS